MEEEVLSLAHFTRSGEHIIYLRGMATCTHQVERQCRKRIGKHHRRIKVQLTRR
jgi:hypothetical protein